MELIQRRTSRIPKTDKRETVSEKTMKCARCHQWINQGCEVYFQKEAYHDHCAVQQSKEAQLPVILRKKKSKFRLIQGGKK